MNEKELLEKFHSLIHEVISSGEKEDVEVALKMFKNSVCLLAEASPKDAKCLLECFEGTLKYYNFLTETEAEEILSKFINQDGSRGAKWKNTDSFFECLEELGDGVKVECEPHYNKWALYVTMHKFASDNGTAIQKLVGDDKEKFFEACYDLAVTQLKDKDKPCWVRWYYGLCD